MLPEHALLTIGLCAAFADGRNDPRERDHLQRFAEGLGAFLPDLPQLYQNVLLRRTRLEDACAALTDPGQRALAMELAIGVCEADGRRDEVEQRFLDDLGRLLGIDPSSAEPAEWAALRTAEPVPATAAVASPPAQTARPATPDEAELDQRILKAAILNGALELLPQSWASMAIIPLQIRLVYGIGRRYGVELDQGHIKEFLATAGVGLTSQYLEQFGRKLIGGLLGKHLGGAAGGLGRAATGMAFSFASTYALGQLAKRYYGGGRQMSTEMIKAEFQRLLAPARGLQTQYLPQIQQRAASLNPMEVMNLVRGST